MRVHFLLLGLLACGTIKAQRTVNVSDGEHKIGGSSVMVVNGEPLGRDKYVDLVSGSPYFLDTWARGTLVAASGQEYNNLLLKVDLVSGQVLYKDSTGREMTALTPADRLLLSADGGKVLEFVRAVTLLPGSRPKDSWMQVLVTGPTTLLKAYRKEISERKPYGSATAEQSISTTERYFLLRNNEFVELGKLKTIPTLFGDKKAELEQLLKEVEKSDLSADERYGSLIAHYNRLLEKKQ